MSALTKYDYEARPRNAEEEISKLREQLESAEQLCNHRATEQLMLAERLEAAEQRAEAAEAKLKAASEQEPTYFVMLDTSPLAGWHVVAEEVFRQYPEDRRLVRYAAIRNNTGDLRE